MLAVVEGHLVEDTERRTDMDRLRDLLGNGDDRKGRQERIRGLSDEDLLAAAALLRDRTVIQGGSTLDDVVAECRARGLVLPPIIQRH